MRFFPALLMMIALSANSAEIALDFSGTPEGKTPSGFRSTVTGAGKPGEWKIVLDQDTPLLPPISPQAVAVTKRPVLAQVSRDPADEHYPLLIHEAETYGDFTFTTRFKIVDGTTEQMAGVAFRIQDEKNYYYVRASALGNTFYFFKFVNGELIGPIGSKVSIARGMWHEMQVECKGSQITCSLDGKPLIPGMQQNDFRKGKIGFWTKSDSVSYFADAKIAYTPVEPPAQRLVLAAIKKYPRLLGLKLYLRNEAGATSVIASSNPAELGAAGGKTEESVIRTGETYYGKEKDVVSVIMPVRDRNGELLAVARVIMKSFPGQTEQNAIIRAMPVVRQIQAQVNSKDDLVE